MVNFTEVKPLRYWVQHILPLVYDDSLSYMELLGKVVNTLNEVVKNNNLLPDYIAENIKEYISNGEIEKVLAEVLANYMLNVKFPPAGLTPATGDGSADDTEAIQGCIDYAYNHGGMSVYFPSGSYLTQPLTLRNKATLFGQDRYTTRLVMKGGSTKAMFMGDVDELTLTGLGFDGNMDIQVNNVNLFTISVNSAIITNCLLTDGYDLLNITVNNDLQLNNIIFKHAVENALVLNGDGFVQGDNLIFKTISALVGKNFVVVNVSNSILEQLKCHGASPNAVLINGNNNVVRLWNDQSTKAYTDNGTGNTVEVYTQSEQKKLTGFKTTNVRGNLSETVGGNKTETITGNKTETIAGDKTEAITGDKDVSVHDLTETVAGNHTKTVTGDINENAKNLKAVIQLAYDLTANTLTEHLTEKEVNAANSTEKLGNKTETITGDKTVNANNSTENITADKHLTAGSVTENLGNKTETITGEKEVNATNSTENLGNKTETITGEKEVNATNSTENLGNKTETITGEKEVNATNSTETIKGKKEVNANGSTENIANEKHVIAGSVTENITGDKHVNVANSVETVQGDITETSKNRTMAIEENYTISAKGIEINSIDIGSIINYNYKHYLIATEPDLTSVFNNVTDSTLILLSPDIEYTVGTCTINSSNVCIMGASNVKKAVIKLTGNISVLGIKSEGFKDGFSIINVELDGNNRAFDFIIKFRNKSVISSCNFINFNHCLHIEQSNIISIDRSLFRWSNYGLYAPFSAVGETYSNELLVVGSSFNDLYNTCCFAVGGSSGTKHTFRNCTFEVAQGESDIYKFDYANATLVLDGVYIEDSSIVKTNGIYVHSGSTLWLVNSNVNSILQVIKCIDSYAHVYNNKIINCTRVAEIQNGGPYTFHSEGNYFYGIEVPYLNHFNYNNIIGSSYLPNIGTNIPICKTTVGESKQYFFGYPYLGNGYISLVIGAKKQAVCPIIPVPNDPHYLSIDMSVFDVGDVVYIYLIEIKLESVILGEKSPFVF